MALKKCRVRFEDVVSIEGLLSAWEGFLRGKRRRKDVIEFGRNLMDHLFELHSDLINGTYRHGGYHEFRVNDPKPRLIHKASVRDRIVHHAIFSALYPFYDSTFIADSYSSRVGKGTHRAINRLRACFRRSTRNFRRTAWVLKCDIRRYFASVDHAMLMELLERRIGDRRIVLLLANIIGSFSMRPGKGIPLGNLTSQLFANVYLNELDQFVKQKLKDEYYIRYADDFVFVSADKASLLRMLDAINEFLRKRLDLTMHPDKVFLRVVSHGSDFLGWTQFPHHRTPRKRVMRRARKAVFEATSLQVLASYLGLLSHGNAHGFSEELVNLRGCNYLLDSLHWTSYEPL